MNPHANINATGKWVQWRGLSVKFNVHGASFGHGYCCPVSAVAVDFKLRDCFDRGASLRGVESPVMALKHRKDRLARTYPQHPSPGL